MNFRGTLGPAVAGTFLAWSSFAEGQAISAAHSSEQPIVVTAKRYGEAAVSSERELDEEDISEYGSNSVGDLLKEISPLVDGSGKQPELLVNGQRVSDPKAIAAYPPEALQRIEILPDQAASEYGLAPEKRVVNLVLKKSFSGGIGSAGFSAPFTGGYETGQISAQYFSVQGQRRWNASVTLGRSSALLESHRTLSPLPGPASIAGNLAASEGGEIDPSLSVIVGFPVTALAVPAAAGAGPLSLFDFAQSLNAPDLRDDAAYRSILPQQHSTTVSLGTSQPLGPGDLGFNLVAGRQRDVRLLGLAEADLLIPASSPFSPFANDVMLYRLMKGEQLTGRQNSSTLSASAQFEAALGKQSLAASLVYSRQEASTATERQFDLTHAQAAISANDLVVNPFGSLPLGPVQKDLVHSVSDTVSGGVDLDGPLPFRLPAGTGRSSFGVHYNRSRSRTSNGPADGFASTRRRTDISASVTLPLASKREGFLPAIGQLSLYISASLYSGTGEGWQTRYGSGLNWSPLEGFSLNGRIAVASVVPDQAQLSAPLQETPQVRIYDYATGELAEVTAVSGGNPDLKRGSNRSLSGNLSIMPWSWEGPSLNVGYERQEARGGIGALPTLTPAVEAAFPERVIRNPEGQLIWIDQRAINFSRDLDESLNTRVNWTVSLGSKDLSQTAKPGFASGISSARPTAEPGRMRRRLRLMLSLSHNWQLRNRLLIREGLPELDRLKGEGGGQSRHKLQAEGRLVGAGSSAALSLDWKSAYVTRSGGEGAGDLRFGALLTVRFEMNLDLGRIGLFGRPKWLRKTDLSVSVVNLLDRRQRVTRSDGSIPVGYLPDEVDPNGRMLTVNLRRQL